LLVGAVEALQFHVASLRFPVSITSPKTATQEVGDPHDTPLTLELPTAVGKLLGDHGAPALAGVLVTTATVTIDERTNPRPTPSRPGHALAVEAWRGVESLLALLTNPVVRRD
jgi:hypothetical protein